MKRISLIFIIQFIILKTIYSQSIDGIYKCNGQSIKFSDNKVEYALNTGGCLITDYNGYGDFIIKNRRLIISPDFRNIPKQIRTMPSIDNDSMTIHVNSKDSIGVTIVLYRKGKIVTGTYTNVTGDGKISRKIITDCDSILLSMIGYSILKLYPDKQDIIDYIVRLDQGPSIEEHQAFITNNGHGFDIKIYTDSIDLKYMEFIDHRQKDIWHKFKKDK